MKPYRYTRLERSDESLTTFRLAVLYPGSFDDDIRVSIRTLPFALSAPTDARQETVTTWDALSYVWGDVRHRARIWIQSDAGPDGNGTSSMFDSFLSVTKNLAECLRHLRDGERARCLWIDAICIDQGEDDEALQERALQVRFMHHFYARAQSLVIWLGPEVDDSTYAIQSLRSLGSMIHVDWKNGQMFAKDNQRASMETWLDLEKSSRQRESIACLLERPWFERTWIRQEAFLSNQDNIVMICGHQLVLMKLFRVAIHFLGIHGQATERQVDRMRLALMICQREFSNVPNTMNAYRLSDCKDQRDKVYATFGILSSIGNYEEITSMPVNYSPSNTIEKVYRDFFVRFFNRNQTLVLLCDAGLRQRSEMRPTWLPDWRSKVQHLLDYSLESGAPRYLRAECEFLGTDVLRVLGCRATRITKTRFLKETGDNIIDADAWKDLAAIIQDSMMAANRATAVERFTRALCCVMNITPDMDIFEKSLSEAKIYISYLFEKADMAGDNFDGIVLPNDMIPQSGAAALIAGVRYIRAHNIPLAFAADQYVGVGPHCVEPGDEVWAVFGSRPLLALRPVKKSTYEVVGPCFMHGFNWGEAVVGQLPEGHTVVTRWQESRNFFSPYFVNTETGSASIWDPRISWDELVAPPPGVGYWPVMGEVDEPPRVRPDSEYLKRHGVNVQQIDLV